MWFDRLDFVRRSRLLIENPKEAIDKEYDVTFALNACVGLLFVLNQYTKNDRRKNTIEELQSTYYHESLKSTYPKDLVNDHSIKKQNLLEHLRNAIAHDRFEVQGEKKKIETIVFKDQKYKGKGDNRTLMEFSIELKVDEFKNLIIGYSKIAERILKVQNQ